MVWFDESFNEIPSYGPINNKPNRRQTIRWTNGDPVKWSIYTSLGPNEFIFFNTSMIWATSIVESWVNEGDPL